MSQRTLLVALHDVTPVHRARLERAERLLADYGIGHVAYLLVPDYHGLARADACDGFAKWCRAPRAFDVRWLLHGYFHHDRHGPRTGIRYRPTLAERLAARFGTGGEAECVALDPATLRERLCAGSRVFEACLSIKPTAFVAPAWLFNRYL